MTPNTFVIGAPKCGTTTLEVYLRQHPDILVSTPKETCFHFADYEFGNNYYLGKYFKGYNRQKIVCDMSILNMFYCQVVAPRIYKDYPDAKLVAVLRDPVKRAFSDYLETIRAGLETHRFEETLDLEEQRRKIKRKYRIMQWMYFSRGNYADQLKKFLEFFPKENIKILLYEELFNNQIDSLNNIFSFLGIDEFNEIKTDITMNVGNKMVRNVYLQRFLKGDSKIGDIIKFITTDRLRKKIVKYLRKINLTKNNGRIIEPDFLVRLKKYYKTSNMQLAEMFSLDLKAWESYDF